MSDYQASFPSGFPLDGSGQEPKPAQPLTPGQVAYEGYLAESNGRSFDSGHVLPEWGDMPEPIRRAWVSAADAVLRHDFS